MALCKKHKTNVITTNVLTKKNAMPPGGHVFQATGTIFKLFHDDPTINVAARVKNAPPPGGHVFLATGTIFKLIQDMIGTNLLTKFHEDRKIKVDSRVFTRKNAPLPGDHNHEDLTINVAFRVLTRKNAPTLDSHVFQTNVTIFELIQAIIETNLLTKFHED
ncbi:hypothetical protein DPMN_183052 [Dreissena polymorpha]|uniref:Uncharacterized protein n=1 Tax=Dreissena polymorpha TaxID=45954 RepID=A0A9D4DGW4_DREPO|nr:hypothetical protein DPMN_183052 [Dreissena polymorpha]